jgi:hypothetical protein
MNWLKTEKIDRLLKLFEEVMDKPKEQYKRTHKLSDYLEGIIEILANNISWRRYNGKINGRVLNNKHNLLCKKGIYEKVYEKLREKELNKENMKEENEILSIDTSFIPNKNGLCKSENNIGKNHFYNNKNGTKLSAIVNKNKFPLVLSLKAGGC